jgi:hypothetical protein
MQNDHTRLVKDQMRTPEQKVAYRDKKIRGFEKETMELNGRIETLDSLFNSNIFEPEAGLGVGLGIEAPLLKRLGSGISRGNFEEIASKVRDSESLLAERDL